MHIRVLSLAVAITAAVLLAGCSATGSEQSGAVTADGGTVAAAEGVPVPDAIAPEEMVTSDKAGAGTAITTTTPADRQIIRTGFVTLRVEDVTKSAFDVHALVTKRNGLISSEDTQSSNDATYSTITAQIPAADLDAFIADVSKLGTVEAVNVNAQDVTTQVVDLDARIKALQGSIDRMTQLMAQATRIEDLLAIETQLSTRQAELDSLTAQRKYLGDQVAMSTITISISPVDQVTTVDAPGFLSGLQNGWAAFLSLIMVAITALGFFLPFLLVLMLIAIPVTAIIVRQSRRHRRPSAQAIATPAAQPSQEAGTPSST